VKESNRETILDKLRKKIDGFGIDGNGSFQRADSYRRRSILSGPYTLERTLISAYICGRYYDRTYTLLRVCVVA